ncbi:MAG: A/G-specific adenine glycosylase [Beutenbergiaceae bacterium]
MSQAESHAQRTAATVRRAVLGWYQLNHRTLPWRQPGVSPWGVMVSEVMLQQTPVVRVQPRWLDWMSRWRTPADLASATPAQVLRAWDRLGYPRRALRLRDTAAMIRDEFAGEVPRDLASLQALPGVGEYTAAAVLAFAYGQRTVVLDTNVRRVLGRAFAGMALPPPSLSDAERRLAQLLLPRDRARSSRWNVAVMELGALVCQARNPACADCPIRMSCRWRAAGFPADRHASSRRNQPWQGTDRQGRGQVMAALRSAGTPLGLAELPDLGEPARRDRILAGLQADDLIEYAPSQPTKFQLPRN